MEEKVKRIIENCIANEHCENCEWKIELSCFWFHKTSRNVPPIAFNSEDRKEAQKILETADCIKSTSAR